MSKPIAAHFVQDYLIATTQWIYGQIRANAEFTPIVLARHKVNPEAFPVDKLYSMDELPAWQRALDELHFRTRGYSRFFAQRLQKPSLIHAHFGHIGFKALGLARRFNIPLITSFYGYDVSALGRNPRYRKRYAQLFAEGNLFLAEGPHLAKSLAELGCPREKIRVFHLGVDLIPIDDRIYTTRAADIGTRVLFAATFTEKKGWADALRAFARASRQVQMRLRLIGGGEDEDLVTKAIRELGIESLVDRSGYVTHDELLREMMASDIFLQPSRTAANGNTEGGAPVTLIDAQSVKLAICATSHADIPEVAPHGVSSLLSPEGDVELLSENLLRLARDPQLRRQFGENGRARIEAEYNWSIQGPRLATIYKSCLTDPSSNSMKIYDME